MHFRIPPAPRSGREAVTTTGLSRAYGENRVIHELDLTIHRGEKVVLVGPNGAGKSTLLRILADRDSNYTGTRTFGAGVALGYYAEDDNWFTSAAASGSLGGEAVSVIEAVAESSHGQTEQQLRNLLGGFLFHGDDVHKSMAVLSGGERSRVALLELLLQPVNLLVLDEPTNHLDMTSKQVLLDALQGYDGTIVFVSHDRSFIDSLATRVIELRPSAGNALAPSVITDFPGDYSYYSWKTAEGSAGDGQGSRGAGPTGVGEQTDESSKAALDQEAHKTRRNRIRQLERQMEELLAEIDVLQARHAEIQQELTDPLIYGVGASVRRLTGEMSDIDNRIADLSSSWEAAESEHTGLLSD